MELLSPVSLIGLFSACGFCHRPLFSPTFSLHHHGFTHQAVKLRYRADKRFCQKIVIPNGEAHDEVRFDVVSHKVIHRK